MFNQIEVKKLAYTLDLLLQVYGFKGINDFSNNSYLSGSSAVKLLKGEQIGNFNDLDIYVEGGLSQYSANLFTEKLMKAGYIENNKKFEYVKSCLSETNNTPLNINETHDYFSLKDHISKIVSLSKNNMKIDIIIIKVKIDELILNTFDYDIVKNYIKINNCDGYVYVNNVKSIDKKHATMKLSHFKNRILDNAYEFNNFIRRFMKYKMRHGYSIFIENLEITHEIFIDILKTVLSKVENIDFNVSKELLERDIIAEILYDGFVYKIKTFNDIDIRYLFKSIYCIFKEKKVNDKIYNLIIEKPKNTQINILTKFKKISIKKTFIRSIMKMVN